MGHKTNVPSKYEHDDPEKQIEDTADSSKNFIDLNDLTFALYLILR